MTHDELRESLSAFALGALDPAEHAEVAAHVAGCAECSAELAALGRVVEANGLDAPPGTPPAALRARVLSRVAAESAARPPSVALGKPQSDVVSFTSRRRWGSGLALAASLALAAAATMYAWTLRSEVQSLRSSMDVLKAPDVLRVDLKGQDPASRATGRAFWSRTAGVMFTADGLPALPAGRVYQLWTIRGATPTSEGIFTLDPSGAASMTSPAAAAGPPDAFGVTIEPAGGSATPTMPIVLIGKAQ